MITQIRFQSSIPLLQQQQQQQQQQQSLFVLSRAGLDGGAAISVINRIR